MCNLPEGSDIQCRLFDEVIKALPDSSSPVTVDIVNGMLFLDAVLQEVLRLYPPIGMVFRPAQKSFNICGMQVPKGTRMVLSIYLLHRNPKVWGKRAEEFIPDRWLGPKQAKAAGVDPTPKDPFAFLPFNAGARQCIGKRFAMIEAKMILVTIARKFKFKTAKEQSGTKYTLSSFISLGTAPQFLVEMEPRNA